MHNENHHKTDVTVIVPAYNSEQFLDEALSSLLTQTIGQDRMEVIIIDDGSQDRTPVIADEYAARYPELVTVIHQQNQGVASARNNGLAHASGTYIAFLDSDDYFSPDAIEAAVDFFEAHPNQCDLVAIQIQMFGAMDKPHWNNLKRFRRSRIINVEGEWNSPHLHAGGTFIRAEALSSLGLKFDERLFVTEDATLFSEIILDRLCYGVVESGCYYYRRHASGASLVQSANLRPEFYTGIPRWSYLHLVEKSIRQYGHVPRYIQAVIAYDICFRFRNEGIEDQSEPVREEYFGVLRQVLGHVEDEVILAQNKTIEELLNVLSFKYGTDVTASATEVQGRYYWRSLPIFRITGSIRGVHRAPRCTIAFFESDGKRVTIEGTFQCVRFGNMQFGFEIDDTFYPATRDSRSAATRYSITGDIDTGWRFSFSGEIRDGSRIEPCVLVKSKNVASVYPLVLRMQRYTRFGGDAELAYFRHEGDSIFRQQGKVLIYERVGRLKGIRRELGFMRRARKRGASWKILILRQRAMLRRHTQKKPIWVLGDRKMEAGDNAEALFRYIQSERSREVDAVFWLAPKTNGFGALKQIGTVCAPESTKHLLAFLSATWAATSASDDFILNPLGTDSIYVNDLRPRFQSFLQHGVTKDDQSAWLNRWRKGFDFFVTSSPEERDSILGDEYGYSRSQVGLTGMPRYDRLDSVPEGLLLLAPTWRQTLAGKLDKSTGRNAPNDDFEASQYFRFWQAILADERLNEALKVAGMRGAIALHPAHAAEVPKYKPGESMTILTYPHNYRDLFSRSNILVTDYSSVAFDFAYLRKPVVYAQPDREEFFGEHLYKPGYFSYDRDGFGPVTETYEETIDELINLVAAHGEISSRYLDRIDSFFAFDDANNSQRVFDSMREISDGGTD